MQSVLRFTRVFSASEDAPRHIGEAQRTAFFSDSKPQALSNSPGLYETDSRSSRDGDASRKNIRDPAYRLGGKVCTHWEAQHLPRYGIRYRRAVSTAELAIRVLPAHRRRVVDCGWHTRRSQQSLRTLTVITEHRILCKYAGPVAFLNHP